MRSAARSEKSRVRPAAAAARHRGILVLNPPAAPAAAKTVVLLGPPGRALDAVAAALEALGVPMSDAGRGASDFDINQALDAGDRARVESFLAQRNAAAPIWGWRRPLSSALGGNWQAHFRNLHVIALFRDVFGIAQPGRYPMPSDVFPAMERSILHLHALVNFLGRQGGPMLLCSERALTAPAGLVAALDEFLHLDAAARRAAAEAAVSGSAQPLPATDEHIESARPAATAPMNRAAARKGALPSFYGIGAQKAGTTWLYAMLKQHPQIHLPARKEIHYWDRPAALTLERYTGYFRAGAINGDITPAYQILSEERIAAVHAATPGARLLLSMRHPVERAWSFVKMGVARRYGRVPPDLAAGEPEGEVLAFVRQRLFARGCLLRSDYARTIRLWRHQFGDDALMHFRYERIAREPRALLAEVCRHIGADPAWADELPAEQAGRVVFSFEDFPFPPALRAEFAEQCQTCIDDLEKLLGERFDDWRS